MDSSNYVVFCPFCDRAFKSAKSAAEADRLVMTHVERAHPHYDPEWYETHGRNHPED